ncbi:MAG: 3-deoxy-8-phosphooctulonate synthase [candidate division Zixibacteria bacterium]|jgi:2-dehydro-3-deoxyphosphooctonate aldolase (KDO 8-P synthase)|nr:3-deoxy-8-phosphooctulonate synthase [candidate division Zixibacteria bacterium]
MSRVKFKIGRVRVGSGEPFIIAGPCAVESEKTAFKTAEQIALISQDFGIPFIYKSSHTKANRLSGKSFSTIGFTKALNILAKVKEKYGLPILTDVHSVDEVPVVAEIVDCLQIPAFLCRQTELVQTAAATGLPINIKKGQFMAAEDMAEIANKARMVGNNKVILTERGTTFGYHDLVVDFRSLIIMAQSGYPVVFDCTHSVQKPGAAGGSSGGAPEYILPLAKAAAAIGVDGLFIETHPNPAKAKSDRECQLPLASLNRFVHEITLIWNNG